MDTNTLINVLTIIVIVVVGGLLAYAFYASQRSKRLKNDFGPEYENLVEKEGSRHKAEDKLSERKGRVESLDLHEIAPDARDDFIKKWERIQQEFVNEPANEVAKADRLIVDVLLARGYPMAPFDRRLENVSVNHPEIVSDYRDAHAVAVKVDQFDVDTEELRVAMLHYQTVFEGLLEKQLEQEHSKPEPEMAEV